MATISRKRRAELARRAQQIRRRCQLDGWPVPRIAAAILQELPQVLPLEAWRWALGWSRPQTVSEIADLYRANNLGDPRVNPSMLCRYEHGQITPDPDYVAALCSVYQAEPGQLGLWTPDPLQTVTTSAWEYRYPWEHKRPTSTDGDPMTSDKNASTLAALRESVSLALEVEGPGGGPQTIENLAAAVAYYDLNYSAFAPSVLADEVHRTRALIGNVLRQPQTEESRAELRRLAGWLSALVGNLAFHLSEYSAAGVHFATAARLGTAVGDNHLTCWSLGAHAMNTYTEQRHPEALELARNAYDYADTPLRRAQILAWAQLRALAHLGEQHRSEARRVMATAQDELAADPNGDQPGRFGFDLAELRLHLAEASLQIGDHTQAGAHAEASRQDSATGRPSWAAATLVLARAETSRGRPWDGAALAAEVLDLIRSPALRETSRARLRALDHDLHASPGEPGREATDLRERIRALPALVPARRISDEPNGS
jgi:tetratricopeptide (TPR) repeat protein